MNNLKKLIGIIPKILLALLLALALVNIISCENMLDFGKGSQGNTTTQPSNPDGGNPQPTEPNVPPKNHYSDYDDFNLADYVIENDTGRPDSEIAFLKDIIWLMYAEREYVGEWTANYIKTNKIKTILSDGNYSAAWIERHKLDRLSLSVDWFSQMLSFYKENSDNDKVTLRGQIFEPMAHEVMHLVQYKSNVFDLTKGMRPDICAATDMLTEFLAWFYTDGRYPGTYITADMENAIETQSKYMVLSTDPWAYDDARAKDPSLPDFIHSRPWFNNDLSMYAQNTFVSAWIRESSITAPLIQASKEDMLRVARAMLACRDRKAASVTDEALWTVFDTLRKVATGDSKYLRFGGRIGARQDSFDDFQEVIANWDAEYAAQS